MPGGITPTYDANGNSTNDSFHQFTWDAENRPVTVVSGSTTVSLTYDALGRMVEQARGAAYTQIVYSPLGSKIATMNGTTLVKGFVPLTSGASAVYNSTGLAYYRHADHLGSSRFASTPSRTMYSDTAYSAFGEPYAQAGTADPSYTGQDQDTTAGLYDFLFRKYDPAQSRWVSPDPSGLAAVNPAFPQSWNRYAYVMNDPLRLIDSFGLSFCSWDDHTRDDAPEDGGDDKGTCLRDGGTWHDTSGDGGCDGDCGGGGNAGGAGPDPFGPNGPGVPATGAGGSNRDPRCPGKIASAVTSAVVESIPPFLAAQILATTSGHVVTMGYDANAVAAFGSFGGSAHAGDALAFDPRGNIAYISTTGLGGGFGGDTGFTGQLGYLRATSVLELSSGSTINSTVAYGSGVGGSVSVDLEGNTAFSLGAGEGVATSATVDVSTVKIIACHP